MVKTALPPSLHWYPKNTVGLNGRFRHSNPQDILRWGLTTYQDDIVMATGFGLSGMVLLHMISEIRPQTTIFFLDTEVHFAETLALRQRLEEQLNINILAIKPSLNLEQQTAQYGKSLWETDPDFCCKIRKVSPLNQYLATKKAWITGIRRDQGPTRANTDIISWDDNNRLLKLIPLAYWTKKDVWRYISEYDLPYNPLFDEGYQSVGCEPCTVKSEGYGERSGRWQHADKTECGIHTQSSSADPFIDLATINLPQI